MSQGSAIEWTEATWNPVVGCTRVSSGCDRCYASRMSYRLETMGRAEYKGLTVINAKGDRHFNGVVRCLRERLEDPLHWKKPRRIFVNSMSDLFHKDVPFEFIDRVFAVMALCPQHTFQILTKRPERMAEYLASLNLDADDGNIAGTDGGMRLGSAAGQFLDGDWIHRQGRRFRPAIEHFISDTHDDGGGDEDFEYRPAPVYWPFSNVWLGTSIEEQATADERIPHLLRCPAAVRFLSVEPLLGDIELAIPLGCRGCNHPGNVCLRELCHACGGTGREPSLDWVIVGGESGPGARPMHPDWARSVRDQCQAAGVPFFFKQGSQANWKNFKDFDSFPDDLKIREYPGVVIQ